MSHVLIISIGPVQEFIASGRKCRDLWFGSWLLSELSLAAARAIQNEAGNDALIFPGGLAGFIPGREGNVANKLVARVGEPRRVAVAAQQAVAQRLKQLADDAFRQVGRGDPKRNSRFLEGKAHEQVEGLIECLWAHADERMHGGYPGARTEAERLLAARKTTKLWSQPSWADTVPKSSLDGVRESVLHESLFDVPRGMDRTTIALEDRRRWYGVHGAERLCGVGLFKRFGRTPRSAWRESEEDVPQKVFSTPHIAALPYLDGLMHRSGGKAKFDAFVSELDELDPQIVDRLDVVPGNAHPISENMDGSILYQARLREAVEEVSSRSDLRSKTDDAAKILQKFISNWGEPSQYFAVLLADGDHMGKAIDQLKTPEEHRKLSNKLNDFASQAREVVQEQGGRLIYSGGDDVLALVPIHQVLTCAGRLADDFAKQLSEFKLSEGGQSPTLSMGIVLAHALVPLDDSLEEARSAERSAKAVLGKDAICVRVIKRGGAPVEIAGKRTIVLDQLKQFIGWHREGELSSKAQYELMDLERLTAGAVDDEKVDLEVLLAHQATRVINRRRDRDGAEISQEIADQVKIAVKDTGGPAAVGRGLYVAQVIARALDQAEPKGKN